MPQCHYSYSGSVLQYEIIKLIINATESSSHNTHTAPATHDEDEKKTKMKITMKMKIADGSHQYCHWPHFLVAFLLDQINHIY